MRALHKPDIMEKKTCLIVAGPTAVGKTDHAIELALQHDTAIISADSRQCYKELNIGVAKPEPHQLLQVPHYFINTHSIHQDVNAADFEKYAIDIATELFKTKDTIILCGGTGLYIRAFTDGLDEIPTVPEEIRSKVIHDFETKGMEWLQASLVEKDPLFAREGEMQNPQRMMRALEVVLATGSSIKSFQRKEKTQRPFAIEYVLIEKPREVLYERINKRVDKMMQDGLLEEARHLFPFKHLNALQTVGYQELFDHFEGKYSLEEAVEKIKQNTRHYAKRQMTWFRKFMR